MHGLITHAHLKYNYVTIVFSKLLKISRVEPISYFYANEMSHATILQIILFDKYTSSLSWGRMQYTKITISGWELDSSCFHPSFLRSIEQLELPVCSNWVNVKPSRGQ